MPSNQIPIDESMSTPGYSYLFGRFRFKVAEDSLTLFSDGHLIALSANESIILRVLIEKQGQFVRTEDLLSCVSKSSEATENLVHVAVRGLRRTLNDADLIKTERSKGYCFTARVEVLTDEAPDVLLSEPNPAIVAPADNRPAEDVRSGGGSSPNTPNTFVKNQPVIREATTDRRRDPFVVIAALVSAAVLVLPFVLAFGAGSWADVTKQLGFIQALMILVALGYDFYFSDGRDTRDANTETRRALVAVQQLRRSWRLLLASWCCLYITLPFSEWLAPSSHSSLWQALQVIATLLNNSSALMLVLCYIVLNRPTVIGVADHEIEDVPLKPGLLLVGGVGLLEAILIALSGHFGLPDYARGVPFGADLLSGVVGGIAMALCISRFDSRLLDTSRLLPIVPIVLYLYVVIQPFYPLLNWTFPYQQGLPQHFDLWIMQLAFMLKSVMYIYVTELFRSQRFLFYMIHARRIYEKVETEWSAFKSAGSS